VPRRAADGAAQQRARGEQPDVRARLAAAGADVVRARDAGREGREERGLGRDLERELARARARRDRHRHLMFFQVAHEALDAWDPAVEIAERVSARARDCRGSPGRTGTVAKSASWSASRCARYASTLMAMCGKKESRCAADSRSAGRRVSGRGGLRMATDAFPSFLPAGRHEGRHGSLHGRNTLISQVNSALYGARILSASVSAVATPWRRRTMCTRDFRQDTLGIKHET
jgi:hypothetical protein